MQPGRPVPATLAPPHAAATDDLAVLTTTRRVKLFGVEVDALTLEQSVDHAEALLHTSRPVHHVCINAAKVVTMQTDHELRGIVAAADLVHVDGVPVRWAAGLLGAPVPQRIAGIDFMEALLARAATRGWRVFFLGATADVVRAAVAAEEERHPGLNVVGFRHGYWHSSEEEGVVAEVRAARPDLLLIALPTPRKERFAHAHLAGLGAGLVMGVGGSFDVAAGLTRRAPFIWQRLGLEWFYRLLQEPRRLWKRYLIGNTLFSLLVAKEALRLR